MTRATYLVGDVFDVLTRLGREGTQVDLVLSSPPFLALRSYLPADHPDKGKEIGSEATPADFIDTMLDVVEACERVLAPHGSLVFELGDTFAGSGGPGGDYASEGLRDGQPAFIGSARRPGGWPMDKSVCWMPELFGASLSYGRNLLRPERTTAPWRVRNKVAWVRPNPPVGALCVDDRTEALTPDGWKRHDQLNDGDLIATYDKRTDSIRFAPAKFVRWEREDEPMVVIEKRKTSQRLTEEHRCLVRTRKRPEPHVVLAGDLTNSHQTMLAAPFEDVGGVEPMSDARAELLGWYVAEGSPKYRQALIRQSLSANPAKVDRIRSLLVDEGADFHESRYRRSSGPYGGDVLVTFHVKGELAAWLNLHHKRLPASYAATWPTTTLRALFRGLIDGDGHRRKDGGLLFFQKERPVVDAVQIIALRLGLRCSVTHQPTMNGWQATIGNPEAFGSSRWTNVRKWDGESIPRESYTGVVWCPMVETSFWLARRDGRTFITGNSDKFRPAWSLLTVACKARDRWFDLDAVRTVPETNLPDANGNNTKGSDEQSFRFAKRVNANPAGVPPLDWWKISPGGYSGSHYAVWPAELLHRPIEAMCPRRVCTSCGTPSRRQTETQGHGSRVHAVAKDERTDRHDWNAERPATTTTTTTGWTTCGCPGADGIRLDGYHDGPGWRPGIVLDPFAGSGTTLMCAAGRGRDAIGIDIDERNADLATERIGMFLSVVTDCERGPADVA